MNKYEKALKPILESAYESVHGIEDDEMKKFDKEVDVIIELVAEKTEQLSRKDKLVVGSEWECVVKCYSQGLVFHVGDVVLIKDIKDRFQLGNIVYIKAGYDDGDMPIEQFQLCFKPKGENK